MTRAPRQIVRTLVFIVALTGLAWTAGGYPVPLSQPIRWELDFESGPLRIYVDSTTGSAYWYFTYEVTNNTPRTRVWAPRLTLFTDQGEIMDSGNDVPSRVERQIAAVLREDYLEFQNEVIGDILVGPAYAKAGLAVWPARNVSVTEVSLFVRGISGESVRLDVPGTGQDVVLYKSLQRDYLVPGNPLARGSAPLRLVEERWIMR